MTDRQLNQIYDRTSGRCHLCHKKLSFINYGKRGTRAPWHIEHSIPKAKGGTDHLRNLYAACISCNLEKGTKSTRTIRSRNGVKAAPLSEKRIAEKRESNALKGMCVGAVWGSREGASGAILGGIFGLFLGDSLPVQ